MKDPNKDKSLPWWVELLFIQIGLPDNWLRSFLKRRKSLKTIIKDNKKVIAIAGLTAFISIYYFPIRRQAILHNDCILSSIVILRSNRSDIINSNQKELRAYATNFCNGGTI